MLKKAQVRFFIILLLMFFILYTLFMAFAANAIRTSHERALLAILITENNTFRNEGKTFSNTLIIKFEGDSVNPENRAVESGGEFFSEQTIADILQRAASFTKGSGSTGNYFFLVTDGENSQTKGLYLFAIDGAEEMQAKKDETLTVFLFLIFLYAVTVLILFGLSFTVFRPIKDNLYRQKRFVSDASHEMRTPVAIISANADVLANLVDNSYLDSIKTQTKRLERLVSDMLALAKTDEEKIALSKENFSVTDEVLEEVLPYEAVLFEKGKMLITDISPDVNVVGDRQSFKTVLGILVDNAIKHSDKGATIKISLKKDGSHAVLKVYNTGSLVREEESSRVFERFYRGDASRSRDSGGSGLGLSIAKSLSDANKWKITARSEYGVSMTITLIL